MKRIFSIALVLLILIATMILANADNSSDVPYGKIEFDFLNGIVYSESREDLEANIAEMNYYCDSRVSAGYENADIVNMYVILKSDFFDQEEYNEFWQEYRSLSTYEEIKEWQIRYTEYSKQYHRDLYAENESVFSTINYESISHEEYSPFVYLRINRNYITVEMLERIALEENVVLLGIYKNYSLSDHSMENEDTPCSCRCHSSGFNGIIWKVLCFFYKLFGINKTCECGASHY